MSARGAVPSSGSESSKAALYCVIVIPGGSALGVNLLWLLLKACSIPPPMALPIVWPRLSAPTGRAVLSSIFLMQDKSLCPLRPVEVAA